VDESHGNPSSPSVGPGSRWRILMRNPSQRGPPEQDISTTVAQMSHPDNRRVDVGEGLRTTKLMMTLPMGLLGSLLLSYCTIYTPTNFTAS
jgi:hypothetical protein